MDFLDKLVIPQPEQNLILLNYLLILGMVIFLVYSGTLTGTTILSMFFKSKSNSDSTDKYGILSKEYLEVVTSHKSYAFGLGLIPLLAIIVSYSQLLHGIDPGVVEYLFIGLVLFIIGVVHIHLYKKFFPYYSFLGFIGLLVLVLSLFLIIGTMASATDSTSFNNFDMTKELVSFNSLIHFVHFFTIALAMGSISYLFKKYNWVKTEFDENELHDETKNLNLWIALITTMIQPLFIVFNLISTPQIGLSPEVFLYAMLALISFLFIAQFLYLMLKNGEMKYVKYPFVLFIIGFGLIAAKEKVVFAVANSNHLVVLNEEYEVHHKEFMEKMGIKTEVINGGDIYNGRCVACHKAEDTPGVAPAHKNVMAKYLANKAELVKFIMSPVKKNPAFPAMPNQGLKPQEADAVADYMIEKYGGKK